MPFTLAHTVVAIPLRHISIRNTRLSLSALVIGSMLPDLPYYLPLQLHVDSHSLAGLFLYCLPAGILAYLGFHLLYKPVMVAMLPPSVRSRLHEDQVKFELKEVRYLAMLAGVLLGALTHILWDGLTHRNTWMVQHFSVMQSHLFDIGSYKVYLYNFLQHASTLAGMIILLIWFVFWYRNTPPREHPPMVSWWYTPFAITLCALVPVTSGLMVFFFDPTPAFHSNVVNSLFHTGQVFLFNGMVAGIAKIFVK